MKYDLEDKVAIVTGGTSGIGLEVARLFAQEGAKLAITGRDEKKMEGVAEELATTGAKIFPLRAELGNLQALDRLADETESALGPIDILVNNAGRSYPGAFFETGPDLWDQILQNRILGPLYLSQNVLARMRERGRGAVVFMSAAISKEPIPENVMAGAAGAGVLGAVKSLARLMATSGVRVNAVILGQFDTPMLRAGLESYARLAGVSVEEAGRMRASQNPMGRLGDPREAAHLAAFLCSDAASYITGALVPVDGGRIWGF